MCKYWLYNLVIYDGVDAFVSKFILPYGMTLDKAISIFVKMGYDGELLKIDALYPLTFDNIIALKDGNGIEKCIFERFDDMFFKID
jgi:hypothetical protein